jgi:glycolate oxidase iron-sulfur subunit
MARQSLAQLDYSVLQQCMHCGMCLPTCPTYDATRRERSSPRGRIALMRAVADGVVDGRSDVLAEEMSYCLGCLACQTACPAGVDYATLFETARAEVESAPANDRLTRRLARAVTLGGLFMRPRLLRAAGRMLRVYQRSGAERLARRVGLTRLLPAGLRRLERQTPRVAARFSYELIAAQEVPAVGEARYRVALLTGCVQDVVQPDVNRDTADALLANGCAVDTPPVQPCCGSLHAHNGDVEGARTLARRMIDLLPPERYDAIVTNAGGCGSHLKHYGALLGDDPAYGARARMWDAKVRDVHEWLVGIGCRQPRASAEDGPVPVTYHESCHLAHGQRVSAAPRAVLALVPGIRVVELPEAAWCCGSAGVYSITQPEQADALLARKVMHVAATGARVVATGNVGCQRQIARGLREAGLAIDVVHPVTLLARAYRREVFWGSGLETRAYQTPRIQPPRQTLERES